MNVRRRMPLSRKLAVAFGLVSLILLVVGLVGMQRVASLNRRVADLGEVQVVAVRQVMLADMLHDSIGTVVYRSILAAQTGNADDMEVCAARLKEHSDHFHKALEELDQVVQKLKTPEIRQLIVALRPDLARYLAKGTNIFNLALVANTADALLAVPDFQASFAQVETGLGVLSGRVEAGALRSASEARADSVRSRSIMLAAVFAGMLAALAISLGFSKSLVETERQLEHEIAEQARLAAIESALEQVEARVLERTAELSQANRALITAHQKVEAGEHHLRMILETQPDCVKLIAAEGIVLQINPAGLRMAEADHPEQILGRSVYDFAAPEYQTVVRELNEAVFRGESRVEEFETITLKGARRWVRTHACPLRDMDGMIIAQLGVTSDIAARKQSEAALDKAHRDLLKASRIAGMAEIATSVLHNVGNVLNSVNVSANIVSGLVRKAPVADLGRVATLLREQGADLGAFFTNDPRAPKVPAFLAQLAETYARQQETQLKEVASLLKNIEHIKDIVAMQQSYAKVSGLAESLSVHELIDDAMRLNAESAQKHDIELTRNLPHGLPLLRADKHKFLQIFVNLVRNAKHACMEAGGSGHRISVRAAEVDGYVRVTVTDTGVGIPPENMDRIFNHGFTTKKNGHGFGLHSSANAAKEMGGSLHVHSDGPGRGAVFTLELPAAGHADHDSSTQTRTRGHDDPGSKDQILQPNLHL